MRYLKYILPILLITFLTISCSKSGLSPTAKPIDTDALIHQISFNAPSQFVATSVAGSKLTMIYYENVSLLIPANGLNLSYALHLEEDFSSAALKSFDYTTVDQSGDVTFDWVDDNLNNVTAKTIKDTVINAAKWSKITVQRPFTFSKTYTDNKSAVSVQDSVLNLKSDKISFSSYVYFTKTYPASTTSVGVYYVKSD